MDSSTHVAPSLQSASAVYSQLRTMQATSPVWLEPSPYMAKLPHAGLFAAAFDETIRNEVSFIRSNPNRWSQIRLSEFLNQNEIPSPDWHATLGCWRNQDDQLAFNPDETYHWEMIQDEAEQETNHYRSRIEGDIDAWKEEFTDSLLKQYTDYKSMILFSQGKITAQLDWEGQMRYLLRLDHYRRVGDRQLLIAFRSPALNTLLERPMESTDTPPEEIVEQWAQCLNDTLRCVWRFPHNRPMSVVHRHQQHQEQSEDPWSEFSEARVDARDPHHERTLIERELWTLEHPQDRANSLPEYIDRYQLGYGTGGVGNVNLFAWAIQLVRSWNQNDHPILVSVVHLRPGDFLGVLPGFTRYYEVGCGENRISLSNGIFFEPRPSLLRRLLGKREGAAKANVRLAWEEFEDTQVKGRACYRVLAFTAGYVPAFTELSAVDAEEGVLRFRVIDVERRGCLCGHG